MNCIACGGACCELISVKDFTPPDGFPKVTEQWLEARALARAHDGAWLLESRCPKLTDSGLCSLHHTDDKPLACAVAPAGAPECLESIRLRRTAAYYAGAIREKDDPPMEEVYGATNSS